MRTIEGYVFIADFGTATPIFGKPIGEEKGDGNYSNIQSNKITPYESLEEARRSAEEFASKRENIAGIDIAKMSVRMAETQQETREFENETGLVAIMIVEESGWSDYRIIGRQIEGKPTMHPIPGALIVQNGLETYTRRGLRGYFDTPFKCASETAYQAARQGQCKATVAKFKLKKIGKVDVRRDE